MDDKMKAAFESWGVERSKKVSTLGVPTPYEYVEWTLDYLRSQQGHLDRKRFERAPCYLCGYDGEGYYQPDKHPCAARYHAKQPATAGEEVMVNTPYDVFTLPLQPSGLDGGPRFVVHVPGPEQPAADQFVATFRCEDNGIIGRTAAKIHSVSRHDDGVIEVVIDHWPEQRAAHPAITHCDNCGCDWLDNGVNPVGCPYCKQKDWNTDEPMIKRFLKRFLFWWVVTTYVGFGALAFAAGHLLLFAAAVVLLVPSFMTVFCAMYDNELED